MILTETSTLTAYEGRTFLDGVEVSHVSTEFDTCACVLFVPVGLGDDDDWSDLDRLADEHEQSCGFRVG